MTDQYSIRCPTCLATNSVDKNISVNKVISCKSCLQKFVFKNALPIKSEVNDETINNPVIDNIQIVETFGLFSWITGLLLIILTSLIVRNHIDEMKGPDFLFFYILLFVGVFILSSLVRWFWKDIIAISLLGFIFFELVAVIRYIDASKNGMKNFGFMIILMIIGGIIFFIRAKHLNNHSGFAGSSGCSSSSCSGGGCGGGCGGCGG